MRALMVTPENARRLELALRSLQNDLTNSRLTDEAAIAAAQSVEDAVASVRPFAFDVEPSTDWSVLGMNQGVRTLGPSLVNAQWDAMRMRAGVTFSNFYHGANGVVHGGAIPLMFDAIFGSMSTSDGVLRRAASLKVDFRSVTLIGAELSVEAHLERTEGRKSWLVGTLRHGDVVTAEAESLWITLKPGGL